EYIHYFSGDGPYRVTMNVIMANGYAFKYVENVAPYENTCAASVQFEAVPVDPEAVAVSQVRVEYTNDNGVVYSSYHPDVEEDPDRTFEVLSITDYDATSTGLETRKVNVLFSCTLYNQQDPNDTMRIDDFTGSIAVSFPQ
ncbi:MAG: hypothetical protein KDC12_09655, partial [Flavobacteriales bacterium]|nr:hypothetical protein [Flavobacteriales bacterium]